MNQKSVRCFTTLSLVIVLFMGCAVAEEKSAQSETLQPIYLELGEDIGQLFYEYDPMGMHILPGAMAIDQEGNFYFLESELRRVQEFSPEGEFVDVLETSEELASSESSYPAGLAIDPGGHACVLWATEEPDAEGLRLLLVRYDSAGAIEGRAELIESPEPISEVLRCSIDEQGFVWVMSEGETSIFTQDGYFNTRIEGEVCGLDPSGKLILRSPEKPVFNRHGAMIGKLENLAGELPDKIVAIDSKGLVLGKSKTSEEKQSDTTLEYTNVLEVFKLDNETLILGSVDNLNLPPTKYRYPSSDSDLALADQVFLLNTAVIVEDTLYLLAYSEERFWVERVSLSQYRN